MARAPKISPRDAHLQGDLVDPDQEGQRPRGRLLRPGRVTPTEGLLRPRRRSTHWGRVGIVHGPCGALVEMKEQDVLAEAGG
jgi:hypothetical protein